MNQERPAPTPASTLLYSYKDRDHTFQESATLFSALYAIGWASYYLTQPETFNNEGSWRKYRQNLGKLVFDKDEPVWNWIVHPYSGSQVYLFFRANGYSRQKAFTMTFWQSLAFEFTTEIYTEPASIQDLYQTPILGTCLGFVLENVSLSLLNTGNVFAKVMGHILNPSTLFWFYEGKIIITPQIHSPSELGFSLFMDF